MNGSESFWHPGSIVRLKIPYKPIDLIEQTGYLPKDGETWGGFTHGMIVEILVVDRNKKVGQVSLHLYDPMTHLLYVRKSTGPIPIYVDFHVDELEPVKDSNVIGYQSLEGKRNG